LLYDYYDYIHNTYTHFQKRHLTSYHLTWSTDTLTYLGVIYSFYLHTLMQQVALFCLSHFSTHQSTLPLLSLHFLPTVTVIVHRSNHCRPCLRLLSHLPLNCRPLCSTVTDLFRSRLQRRMRPNLRPRHHHHHSRPRLIFSPPPPSLRSNTTSHCDLKMHKSEEQENKSEKRGR